MSLDAMKQALEALEEINKLSIGENAIALPAEIDTAMDALRERLAQPELEQAMTDAIIGGTGVMLGDKRIDPASIYKHPEQEPVAWQVMVEDEAMKEFPIKDMAHDWCAKKKLSGSPSAYWIRPLYTAPRQWQGLTDEEREQVINANFATGMWQMAKDIEAKLKEKNT